ncbi:unnamed protein product [Allacma fusca]|uniref:Uncharacterized protein n=1 Tax=Allacma fusca TaxID=39272 RepID=A0A8J2KTV1_9HEXA|nr:unnamed protein product [Allacma fusca]
MHSTETSQDVRFSVNIAIKIQHLSTEPEVTLINYEQPTLQAIRKPGGRFVPQKPFPKKPIPFSAKLKQLLENLYPPIEWKQSNCVYSKTVSTTRGRTSDILNLADKIKHIIDAPSQKMFNISEINQKLLLQAFDEIIRQILVEKPLQGLLLREVRDYTEKFLEVRRSVFASNTAFSFRKEFRMTEEIETINDKLEENKAKKSTLRERIARLTEEKESSETKHKHLLETDMDDFQNELQPLISEKRRLVTKLKHLANLVAI